MCAFLEIRRRWATAHVGRLPGRGRLYGSDHFDEPVVSAEAAPLVSQAMPARCARLLATAATPIDLVRLDLVSTAARRSEKRGIAELWVRQPYVGWVGGLAVALGVGAAVMTGYGCGVAWADVPGSRSSSSSSSPRMRRRRVPRSRRVRVSQQRTRRPPGPAPCRGRRRPRRRGARDRPRRLYDRRSGR